MARRRRSRAPRFHSALPEIEARLEGILERDIAIAAPNWMVIGRQVPTSYGKFIDRLAIEPDGNPLAIEPRRDGTQHSDGFGAAW